MILLLVPLLCATFHLDTSLLRACRRYFGSIRHLLKLSQRIAGDTYALFVLVSGRNTELFGVGSTLCVKSNLLGEGVVD